MSDLDRRLGALEKRLLPPRLAAPIRQDVAIRDPAAVLAVYRVLYKSGGRELVESVFLSVQSDEPLLDELLRALEKVELVEEAERVVQDAGRGGTPEHESR